MALSTSITINGIDVRTTYGLEILSIEGLNGPGIRGDSFEATGIPGQSPGVMDFQARTIKMSGWINASSHANLLTYIDLLTKAINPGHNGNQTFKLVISDLTDRYFECRLSDSPKINPIGARATATWADVELSFICDNPFGIYNAYSFANLTGSPFSSPYCVGYNHGGQVLTRPRIMAVNAGAASISQLRIINTACKSTLKTITPSIASLTRETGVFNDPNGAMGISTGGEFSFACQNNFTPNAFSVVFFVRASIAGNYDCLFSTTGDVIGCYEDDGPPAKFIFEINGTKLTILHSAIGFGVDEWLCFACGYDGAEAYFKIWRMSNGHVEYVKDTPSAYTGLPTNFFLGTKADKSLPGTKRIDELRLYNHCITGIKETSGLAYDIAAGTGKLPIGRGCTGYFPFDYSVDGQGLGNTDLYYVGTMAQYTGLEIDTENMRSFVLTQALGSAPASGNANISGEYPFLLPGYNGLQIIHNGSASGLNLAIEEKRRFL